MQRTPYHFAKCIGRIRRMGNRSQMRKFRKRRQRAGFALLASFVIVVLGVVVFFRTDPFQKTSEAVSVERVAVPMIGGAPEAVAEDAGQQDQTASVEQSSEDGSDNGRDKKQPAEKTPVAPVPANNDLWMTIPTLGLYDNYVANSNAHSALDYGAAKRVETGFPWQNDANTYISATTSSTICRTWPLGTRSTCTTPTGLPTPTR
jgi:hypothetical protein